MSRPRAILAVLIVALSAGYAAGRYQTWYPCIPSATYTGLRMILHNSKYVGQADVDLTCGVTALPSAYNPCQFCLEDKMLISSNGTNWVGNNSNATDRQVNCPSTVPAAVALACWDHPGHPGYPHHRYETRVYGATCAVVDATGPPPLIEDHVKT